MLLFLSSVSPPSCLTAAISRRKWPDILRNLVAVYMELTVLMHMMWTDDTTTRFVWWFMQLTKDDRLGFSSVDSSSRQKWCRRSLAG